MGFRATRRGIERGLGVGSVVAGGGLLWSPAALAHGIQGRADLPVPILAFYWAASIILVVSFVGLALGWKRPVLAEVLERRSATLAPGPIWRAALVTGRVIAVAMLGLVLATALIGARELNANLAPIWVFVAWWIGIALLAATVGDAWRALHPIAAIARALRVPERAGSYPDALGVWPAFVGLAVFTWLELVYPTAANVRLLGLLIAAWVIATLAAMVRWGVVTTLDRIEPFAVYTRLIGSLGVFGIDADGRLERRPPVLGVLRTAPVPGLAAFVGLLIGSVSYDGLSRTLWWKQRVSTGTVRLVERGLDPADAQRIFGTFGLLVMIALAICAFLALSRLSTIVGRLPPRSRFGSSASAFAPSLIPIALAYVVAHYFSFFWFQGQEVFRLASDPFGRGWNLLGTSDWSVDYSTLSANAIWIVQVAAIVIGHVLALVLAHDRALEIEHEAQSSARAVRSQWPMLALMVIYTVGGLYFLSEGLNG